MIELIYNEEGEHITEEKVLLEPKNIKQIGEPEDLKKIFIEDFAYTYLHQYAEETNGKQKISILLGKSERGRGKRHIYIKSALAVDDVFERQGKYCFTEKVWGWIYQECEKYFPEQEIIGWFLVRPGFSPEKNGVIEETHRTYFSGADKVLFMIEPVEKESAFWGFNGNCFTKQKGYYVYYEKNTPMQAYMIEKNQRQKKERSVEKPDATIANFRKILKEKQEKNVRRKKKAISYGTKIAVLLVLFVGVVALNNQFEEKQKTEQTINKTNLQEPLQNVVSDEVVVEELAGDVTEQTKEEVIIEEEYPITEQEEEPVEEAEESIEEIVTDPPVYKEYCVQEGDTLAKISREHYGTDAQIPEICHLNGITNGDYIQAGEIILLP